MLDSGNESYVFTESQISARLIESKVFCQDKATLSLEIHDIVDVDEAQYTKVLRCISEPL